MSFYIVPTMSYQQKQKMKKPSRRAARAASSSTKKSSDSADTMSLSSESIPENVSAMPGQSFDSPRSVSDEKTESEKRESVSSRKSLSRRRSESSQSFFPSLTSRRPSWASEASRHSSSAGLMASFGLTKSSAKASEILKQSSNTEQKGEPQGSATKPDSGDSAHVSSPNGPELASGPWKPQFRLGSAVPELSREPSITEYTAFTDLSIFNSEKAMRKTFLNPGFVLKNFELFLDSIAEHHADDPINFATVRAQSLRKFLTRRNMGLSSHWSQMSLVEKKGGQRIEDFLGHELLKCRSIMRTRVKLELKHRSSYRKLACEQLIQGNFINYVRYILMLPECSPRQAQTLSELQRKDDEVRRAFHHAADALYAIKCDNYEGDISTVLPRMDLFLQSIIKTSFDFLLLEKYTIQILAKLNNNFLIEARITRQLFDLYNLNLQLSKQESLKVLVFNSSFSCAYSWYLATTIPFVRVFEASLLNENAVFADPDGHESPSASATSSLKEKDSELYKNYFSRLGLPTYASFAKLSRRELVDMQRYHASKVTPGKISVKPINFEYYAHSLSSIDSETFHVIQCRDLRSQIVPANHGRMLGEFYRLLKKGGVLELPMVISSTEDFGFSESEFSSSTFHKASWSEQYFFEAVRDIVKIVGDLFGPPNVKFSSLLLTSKNQMNNFLIKHNAMSMHESLSEIDSFQKFTETTPEVEKTHENDLHFYFYLRAEKP